MPRISISYDALPFFHPAFRAAFHSAFRAAFHSAFRHTFRAGCCLYLFPIFFPLR